MSNHLHSILRSRPDIFKTWSDEEVARRWWNLFPQRRNKDGSPAEPAEPADTDLNHLMADAKVLAELRARQSNISWFMRCTSEVIARMANAEDECTGRFCEGRFKATVLPDEAAIAACMVYVDLNPIRAGLAASPEKSDFKSAQERIADLRTADNVSTADARDVRIERGQKAGWLAPVELEPKRKKVREKCSSRRASNKGCVFMSLPQYLELLDWTGRQLKPGKTGSNPKERSADSGKSEPVSRSLAARRGAIRQTPSCESHHPRVEIQRHGEARADVRGSSVGPYDS